jgi:hypothetical protein
MQNPIFSALVTEWAKSGRSFLVEPKSVHLMHGTVGASPIDVKIRGHLADWKTLPNIGDRVLFSLRKNGGEFKILPAVIETSTETVQAPPAEPIVLKPALCIGDRTVEPFPDSRAMIAPLDEVVKLSWRDVFGPIGRWFTNLFSRGLKARAAARS